MLPLLVGGLGVLYSVGRAYDSARYWNDYRKRTGKSPRYPARAGALDWAKYGAAAGYSYSRLKRL